MMALLVVRWRKWWRWWWWCNVSEVVAAPVGWRFSAASDSQSLQSCFKNTRMTEWGIMDILRPDTAQPNRLTRVGKPLLRVTVLNGVLSSIVRHCKIKINFKGPANTTTATATVAAEFCLQWLHRYTPLWLCVGPTQRFCLRSDTKSKTATWSVWLSG